MLRFFMIIPIYPDRLNWKGDGSVRWSKTSRDRCH